MNIEENAEIISFCNDLQNFITDFDLNVSLKGIFGVCPVGLALLIIKNIKEEKIPRI